MSLCNQAISNQVQDAFSNMPVCVLYVLDSPMSKYAWLLSLYDLATAFKNSLSYHYLTVWELLNEVCHQLSVVLFEVYQVQDQEFICKNMVLSEVKRPNLLTCYLNCSQTYFEVDILDKLQDKAEEWSRIRHEVHLCCAIRLYYLIQFTFNSFDGICSFLYDIKRNEWKNMFTLTFHWFFSFKASMSSSLKNANKRPFYARGYRDSCFASKVIFSRSFLSPMIWLVLLWMISRPATLKSLWFGCILSFVWLYWVCNALL